MARIWRPSVGWLEPSARAAADKLPSSATLKNARTSDQSSDETVAIQK